MATQFEAEVPAGMQPGQTFMAQTPSGLVSLIVPPGHRAGQKLRFSAPAGAGGQQAPVLLGAVLGSIVDDTSAARPGGQNMRYRVSPENATLNNLPVLQGIPVAKAERKLEEIHKGATLAQQWPVLPPSRRCRDALWILPFLAIVALVVGLAIYFSPSFTRAAEQEVQAAHLKTASLESMIAAGAAGAAASLLASLAFAGLARRAPGCVVWTSLLFGPSALIVCGLVILVLGVGHAVLGFILVGAGLLCLSCVFCCYRPFIPFTIRTVEVVAGAMKQHPGMVLVALCGSLFGIAWSLACAIAFVGAYRKYETDIKESSGIAQYGLLFSAFLVFVWGAQVAYNVCHVTYCGVFARWYHRRENVSALRKSFTVAVTTSFGSICMGSFLVAAVRALEFMVRQARRSAQEEGSLVCCVVLLVIECIVACIGDILEYFSEWAYVQCAVRGVSFLDGARITYSMITCANLEYVISDLLINSVVNFGALLCAAVGGGVGAMAGLLTGGSSVALSGAVIGFWSGLVAGSAAVGVLSSGAKTILALWAEDPEPLRLLRPELHGEFERKITSKLQD